MKFAHIADVHLGSWREPKLRELSTRAFIEAIDRCIQNKVQFVLIAGDLFNTSLPAIDSLKTAVSQLKRLKSEGIPVYTIAGSHDFSPSGKTMLEVLEEADLTINVCKGEVVDGKLKLNYTTDERTGAKIAGMIGRKGMLEKRYYEDLIHDALEDEKGFRIFMFHTAISELKPAELEKMESAPISLLPKGLDYYAGGHVHIVREESMTGYSNVVYPGPTFPNSFAELEKLKSGGLYIYSDGKTRYERIELCPVTPINIKCDHMSAEQVTDAITENISGKDLDGAIVLLRLSGRMETGKTSEINFRRMIEMMEERGAHLVLKNTSKLVSKEFEEIKVKADTTEEAERMVIEEHLGQVKSLGLDNESEKDLVVSLMNVLDKDRDEGEKHSDYESRVITEMSKMFRQA